MKYNLYTRTYERPSFVLIGVSIIGFILLLLAFAAPLIFNDLLIILSNAIIMLVEFLGDVLERITR